ncbi:MAG: hypothetical protein J3K34DRAFT_189949 [Monoraphidium minutum]|nr:MAG: hypothetical protein J3K34DRAFT_189949 [Monoraphidium minutum]
MFTKSSRMGGSGGGGGGGNAARAAAPLPLLELPRAALDAVVCALVPLWRARLRITCRRLCAAVDARVARVWRARVAPRQRGRRASRAPAGGAAAPRGALPAREEAGYLLMQLRVLYRRPPRGRDRAVARAAAAAGRRVAGRRGRVWLRPLRRLARARRRDAHAAAAAVPGAARGGGVCRRRRRRRRGRCARRGARRGAAAAARRPGPAQRRWQRRGLLLRRRVERQRARRRR